MRYQVGIIFLVYLLPFHTTHIDDDDVAIADDGDEK
jgi:hypothetical protein